MKLYSILILLLSYNVLAEESLIKSLEACPDKPNCAITIKEFTKRDSQYIEPLTIKSSDLAAVKSTLITLLKADSKFEIQKQDEKYIKTTFTSSLFKFVDDVEFILMKNEEKNHILLHARSASQTGYYDFDANKKRIKSIFKQMDNNYTK